MENGKFSKKGANEEMKGFYERVRLEIISLAERDVVRTSDEPDDATMVDPWG